MAIKLEMGDDWGPNDTGVFTAGIRIGDHGNAVECYGSTLKEAQERRDAILALAASSLHLEARTTPGATIYTIEPGVAPAEQAPSEPVPWMWKWKDSVSAIGYGHPMHGWQFSLGAEKPSMHSSNAEHIDLLPLFSHPTPAPHADEAAKWISVGERLPADETEVLIILDGQVRVGAIFLECQSYEEGGKTFRYWDDPYDDGQAWEFHQVTHWMPLPAAPVPPAEGVSHV